MLDEDEGMLDFSRNLWQRIAEDFWSGYESKPGNLYYNGDFRYDLDFWSYIESENDSVIHRIKTENNNKYLEIARYKGVGFFQLVYNGRPIYFHKDVSYKLSFDYRVVEGSGRPFKVGWWILDNGKRPGDLPVTVTGISDGWNHCEVFHVFKEDHIKPPGFINSQQPGTIIQIKDISLKALGPLNRFDYSDQISGKDGNLAGSKPSNSLFSRRIDLLQFALHIWKTEYSLQKKLFGGGFDYLPLYGDKFNEIPGSYSYPHNPAISAFLYSGILGGLFYIYFILMVFYYYWRCRRKLFLAFSLYIIAFLFSMFSGNSHFSVTIFAYLSFIPFIYKAYSELEGKKATP